MSLAKSIQSSLADPAANAIESGSRWFARRGTARKAATRVRSALADNGGWSRSAIVGSAALGAMVAALAYYNVRKARQNESAPLPVGRFIDDARESGSHQIETVTSASNSNAERLRAIAAEATEYSRQSFDNSHAFFESLMRAQKLDDLIELQSEFVRRAYGDFFTRALKVVWLCSNMAIEAFASSLSVSEATAKVSAGASGKLFSDADRQAKEITSEVQSAAKQR